MKMAFENTTMPAHLQVMLGRQTNPWQYLDQGHVINPYPVQGVQPGVLSAVALQQSQWPLR